MSPSLADPDGLVVLTSVRTEFEGSVLAAALEREGLPSEVFATAAATLQWEGGYTDPIRVMVRRQDVARAREVLRELPRMGGNIDWRSVDVGQSSEELPEALTPLEQKSRRLRRARVRRAGIMLISLPMLLPMLAPASMGVALGAAALAFALSWNDEV